MTAFASIERHTVRQPQGTIEIPRVGSVRRARLPRIEDAAAFVPVDQPEHLAEAIAGCVHKVRTAVADAA